MTVSTGNEKRQMVFTRDSVPKLAGRTAVVTGANGGLGLRDPADERTGPPGHRTGGRGGDVPGPGRAW